ncbi:hypothetical protein LR48_Vigan10g123000 [Vigna angularis]|uniref:Uncharacterized protein n=1 Tax=Phaseolus angularis TaxID=3914 RepID=A0A0L9VK20_PHAAN|nr:hypothetical protein LR48_Vigan10g123000 [Vigna angularis]
MRVRLWVGTIHARPDLLPSLPTCFQTLVIDYTVLKSCKKGTTLLVIVLGLSRRRFTGRHNTNETSCNDCLYVERAFGVLPSSVAK